MMFVRLSVCSPMSETGVHCDHTVHVSADLSLRLDSPMFWAPWHQSMSTYSEPSFSSSTWKRGGVWMCKLGVISQESWRQRLSYYWVLIRSHICRVDWHNNGWPSVTLNGRFTYRALSLQYSWISHVTSFIWNRGSHIVPTPKRHIQESPFHYTTASRQNYLR